jgi:hypothetical protein
LSALAPRSFGGKLVVSNSIKAMHMSHEERQQMIVEVLTPRPGDPDARREMADRLQWSWQQIALHLTPLIGEAGFQSLYARTVHLTMPHVAGLRPAPKSTSFDAALQRLKEDLASLAPADAERAGKRLLATFTELLSTLIGEALTARILRTSLTGKAGDSHAQEMKE